MVRALAALLLAALSLAAQADEALWKLLREGGQVLFIRHATTTPGVGDPPGFRLDACASQRNLSDEGRAEARRLGETLRARIGTWRGKGNLVLISHGSTALPLSGISPQQAEIIVLTPGGGERFTVAGRIPPP